MTYVTSQILGGIVGDIGLGLATNAVYDVIKSSLGFNKGEDRKVIEAKIQNVIDMHGMQIEASTVIEMLARKGVVSITGSQLFAPKSIHMGAAGGSAYFGDNSTSATAKSSIQAIGIGTGIKMSGNASIRQNEDGSISFYT